VVTGAPARASAPQGQAQHAQAQHAQAQHAHRDASAATVAVVERPVEVAMPPQEVPRSRVATARPDDDRLAGAPELPVPVQSVAVNEADAAWLAGVPLREPGPVDEPGPDWGAPPEEPERARQAATVPVTSPDPAAAAVTAAPSAPVAGPAAPAQTAPAQTAPAHTAPAHTAAAQTAPAQAVPGALRRESPLEAVQRHALQARGAAPARPVSAGARPADVYYDDVSADDPDITSTGLVGVPLVVRMLDGMVIEEKLDNE
jgi:DNA polymerase-3 subunit gamma/tau